MGLLPSHHHPNSPYVHIGMDRPYRQSDFYFNQSWRRPALPGPLDANIKKSLYMDSSLLFHALLHNRHRKIKSMAIHNSHDYDICNYRQCCVLNHETNLWKTAPLLRSTTRTLCQRPRGLRRQVFFSIFACCKSFWISSLLVSILFSRNREKIEMALALGCRYLLCPGLCW